MLNSVNLDIHSSEFLTLVGPSGCGKSTLLRILAGLEDPDGGEVQIDGVTVNATRAADRNLAMVFQSYALYPHLTVSENMLTPLRLRDLTWRQRLPFFGPLMARSKHRVLRSQVTETAQVLKIEQLLARKPGQLSGGQRQRVALGRAMVRKPKAFLMDEPLSNLDAALRVHMRAELAELHRDLGTTFIYVTHDQAEALTMSSRMAVMMDGDILQLDSPQTIYEDPDDIRVAKFIGSPKINILEGEVDSAGRVSAAGIPLRRTVSASCAGQISLGLRPEHLRLTSKPTPETFEGTVAHAENLGSDLFLHLTVGGEDGRLIVRASPAEAAGLAVGDEVHVERVQGEALFFDRNGMRIRPDKTPAGSAVSDMAVA
ncbi:MAG: ABC transporter ATP-binding protein [Pseudomonadota bacterium]